MTTPGIRSLLVRFTPDGESPAVFWWAILFGVVAVALSLWAPTWVTVVIGVLLTAGLLYAVLRRHDQW